MKNNGRKTGIELIAEERQRQIEEEGLTFEHDTQWKDDELCRAAVSFIERPHWMNSDACPEKWPFDVAWWKLTPQDRIRELQKAGALIAAEIDRLLKMFVGEGENVSVIE